MGEVMGIIRNGCLWKGVSFFEKSLGPFPIDKVVFLLYRFSGWSPLREGFQSVEFGKMRTCPILGGAAFPFLGGGFRLPLFLFL
jgi:hypothetical protein